MPDIQTRWWGVILSLSKDEACFVSAPRTQLAQLATLIPAPFGEIVMAAIVGSKLLVRQNIGDQGTDVHINWAGVPHWIARRGNQSSCPQDSAFRGDELVSVSRDNELSTRDPTALALRGANHDASDGLQLHFLPLNIMTPPARAQQLSSPAALQPDVDPQGNIFSDIDGNCIESTFQGKFHIEFVNNSGRWISIDVQTPNQSTNQSLRVQHGETGYIDNMISVYKGGRNKINRWRPGFLNIAGNGGGEIFFDVPQAAGSGYLRFTVVG